MGRQATARSKNKSPTQGSGDGNRREGRVWQYPEDRLHETTLLRGHRQSRNQGPTKSEMLPSENRREEEEDRSVLSIYNLKQLWHPLQMKSIH